MSARIERFSIRVSDAVEPLPVGLVRRAEAGGVDQSGPRLEDRRAARSQQVPPLEVEIAGDEPLADLVMLALDDVDAEMRAGGSATSWRSCSRAAAVTARVTSSALSGSRAAIASSSSSRSTTTSSKMGPDQPARRADHEIGRGQVGEFGEQDDHRAARQARRERGQREGVVGLVAAIVDRGGQPLQLAERRRRRRRGRWRCAGANRRRGGRRGRRA